MPTCFLLLLLLDCHTHKITLLIGESGVLLKHHYNCTGSHNTICSKFAQLTLRKGHNSADSLAHSQAEPQAYWCLGWRDREVVVGDVEPNVETMFGDNFWSELRSSRCNTIRSGTITQIISLAANYFYLSLGTPITTVKFS